jgi:hypothetical protein
MTRRNRVTPWGTVVAQPWRGTLTGNRSRPQWICCRLEWKGNRQPLDDPHRWRPVFFTDEACALAAGHRPCFACRRDDAKAFLAGRPLTDVDAAIAAERRAGRMLVAASSLPEGSMVDRDGDAWLVWHGRLHRWAGSGYDRSVPIDDAPSLLLTPATTVALLRAGYVPQVAL